MKPPTPDELEGGGELEPEGMMFVGDAGKIVASFRGERPRIVPAHRMRQVAGDAKDAAPRGRPDRMQSLAAWVAAARGGAPTYGDFLLAGPISDAFNLGAVSLRLGGKRLRFDAAAGRITNAPDANRHLGRDYRAGWELAGA